MNVVMIVPTGIGAEIGGHAGDANPAAKLLGACADNLVLHPNVVNASDINEMPPNAMYVEGSMLDRFMCGCFCLERPTFNRILLVVNAPLHVNTQNSAGAARCTLGADIEIMVLDTPLCLTATKAESGAATGNITGIDELYEQVTRYGFSRFDALAIQTPVEVSQEVAREYMVNGGVNPWGGVEAMASRTISEMLGRVPVAHAPFDSGVLKGFNEVVDSRLAAEMVSASYLHCVLKGLHTAPRASSAGAGLSINDIDVLVSPFGCWGEPHVSATANGITILMVRENTTCLDIRCPSHAIVVENYWEAAGYIMALKAGISPETVRRPLA